MDIHKPHAAKSWREFLIEIGTIVIGILIALGLEQAIENYHANQKTEEARQAIAAELRFNIAKAKRVVEMRDCSERQLAALADAIGKGDRAEVRRQVDALRLPVPITWTDAAWRTALASDASDRFSEQERRYAPVVYEVVNIINANQNRYVVSGGRLQVVAQSGLSNSGSAESAELSDLAEMTSALRGMEGAAQSLVAFKVGNSVDLGEGRADPIELPSPTQVADCKAAAGALGPAAKS